MSTIKAVATIRSKGSAPRDTSVDVTRARDGVKELRAAFGPVRATEMVFVTSALYPDIQEAEHRTGT
jgi:hypothetical protein